MPSESIWIIDHDIEDHDIIKTVWKDLNLSQELVFFNNAEEAFATLTEAERAPFIIICELNLPGVDGFELRQRLLDTHQKKFRSVPFIFWTSYASEAQITKAYDLSGHGVFIKESTLKEMEDTFITIIRYWLKSKMPSKTEQKHPFE